MRDKKNLWWILAILAVAMIFDLSRGGAAVNPAFGDEALTLTAGDFSLTVAYADIRSAALAESPDYGESAGGGTKNGLSTGAWHNGLWGDYTLCANEQIDACIALTTVSGVVVFNAENLKTTEQIYGSLPEFFSGKGFDGITYG